MPTYKELGTDICEQRKPCGHDYECGCCEECGGPDVSGGLDWTIRHEPGCPEVDA